MSDKKEKFILGSGKLYITEYTGGEIPDDKVLEVEENRLGAISGGATIEYKPTYYAVTDDLGEIKKSILTAEEVTFKSGLMARNMDFVNVSAPTARAGSAAVAGQKQTKIGGLKNVNGKSYVVRFLHVSTVNPAYALRATIIGTMAEGFSLAFAKDKETIPDLTFSAEPMDDEGTLILISEPAEAEPAPNEGA